VNTNGLWKATTAFPLKGRRRQFHSSQQLRIQGYDDGGKAHGDGSHVHRQINSPAHEEASGNGDRGHVVGRRPNQVRNHFSLRGTRKFDRGNDIARIVTSKHDISRLNRHVGSRAYRDADIRGS